MDTVPGTIAGQTTTDLVGGIVLAPDGRKLYARDSFRNEVVVIDTERLEVVQRIPTGDDLWGIVIRT